MHLLIPHLLFLLPLHAGMCPDGCSVPPLLCAGKPRGYAFIEFEHKNDMKEAYKVRRARRILITCKDML